jgi:hypothetical protein
MKLRIGCIQLFLLCSLAFSQAKPADPAPAPVPTLSAEQKVSLLTLQHKLDATQKQMKDLDLQFQQLQTNAKNQFQSLQQQESAQKAELDAAQKRVLSDMKLDPARYDLNLETLAITAKPEPPKPAETAKK